ncbi:MAG: phosphate propanoyltransferase [Enterocloster asparagiformis]|nr:phosphate propanoyltransferase [Enterocloster asparagiformis]
MWDRDKMAARVAELVAAQVREFAGGYYQVPVGISARHVHLTRADVEALFGPGHRLTPMKALSQPGQFACEEQVELSGPKGVMARVRVLGPERPASQVELSGTDCIKLGIDAPVRTSGHLEGTPGILLKGPAGSLELGCGVIVADRHIHMTPEDARWFGVADKERVGVRVGGPKGGVMGQVVIRVSETARLDFHVDTDDANAFRLKQGQLLELVKEETR